ncbi:unnamed protein product [Didymodactylos carnosus]|uniref:Fanconi anemia group D2 protein n=1 Tax=Didymodactylos carnosus TaxID=1234261 RepID=A0A8S2GDM5_9BILA|nr:unnamed protein product [Didymodactylos carnosus]CAF3498399.1 unnamed protein product [Didymodactylos carnosus]
MYRGIGTLRSHERSQQQAASQWSQQQTRLQSNAHATIPSSLKRRGGGGSQYFCDLLKECGIDMVLNDEENMNNNDYINFVLTVDQAIFIKRMSHRTRVKFSSEISATTSPLPVSRATTTASTALSAGSTILPSIHLPKKTFLAEIESFLNNEQIFRSSLMPTITADGCDTIRGANQDSLLRLLMCVDDIQSWLGIYLLDKLVEYINSDKLTVGNLPPVSMTRLILQTFHYLPISKSTDGKEMLKHYFDILQVMNKETISYMVEIINELFFDDKYQDTILEELIKLIDPTTSDITKQVLKTLTQMKPNLKMDGEIRSKIIPLLPMCSIEIKTEMLCYMLETSKKDTIGESLHHFRQTATVSLRLDSMIAAVSSTAGGSMDKFESIQIFFDRFEYYFNSSLGVYKACQEHKFDNGLLIDSHFLFDLFICLLLVDRHYYSHLKTFATKLGEDIFKIKQIHQHLINNISFVNKYSHFLLKFANALFQHLSFGNFATITTTNTTLSSGNLIHLQIGLQFGIMLYELLFSTSTSQEFYENIVDIIIRQIIIFQNRYLQRLYLLKLLKKFCYRYQPKMNNCESFLRNFLEYIDIFQGEHLRLVFAILASMHQSSLHDQFNIFVTKCLIQPHKEKEKGVFGAVELCRSLLAKYSTSFTSTNATRTTACMNSETEIRDLLALVQNSGQQCPHTLALFYDELAAMILTLKNKHLTQTQQFSTGTFDAPIDSKLFEWFANSAADTFSHAFVSETNDSDDRTNFPHPTCIQYCFRKDTDNPTIIDMTHLVVKYHQYRSLNDPCSSPVLLAPLLNLIVICSSAITTTTIPAEVRVDAILQCSLRLPDILRTNDGNNDESVFLNENSLDDPIYRRQYENGLKIMPQETLRILCDIYYYSSYLFREIFNLLCSHEQINNDDNYLITKRLAQLTDIEEYFATCVKFYQYAYGLYRPVCSNNNSKDVLRAINIKKKTIAAKKPTTTKKRVKTKIGTTTNKKGIKRKAQSPIRDDDEENFIRSPSNLSGTTLTAAATHRSPGTTPKRTSVPKIKPKAIPPIDIYLYDIRQLKQSTFRVIMEYLEPLLKSKSKERLIYLRCIQTLTAEIYRFLTQSNTSTSTSNTKPTKRISTTQAPAIPTQLTLAAATEKRGHDDENEDDDDDESIDEQFILDFGQYRVILQYILRTMKAIQLFLQPPDNIDDANIDTQDRSFLVDDDSSRDIAITSFRYAVNCLYQLLIIFKVKRSIWEKQKDYQQIQTQAMTTAAGPKQTNCLSTLMLIINKCTGGNNNSKPETMSNEKKNHTTAFKSLIAFENILAFNDKVRLCQCLEQIIQLFNDSDDEVYQDSLANIFSKQCRVLLQSSKLASDVSDSSTSSLTLTTKTNKSMEILLNLYFTHCGNDLLSVLDELCDYSKKQLDSPNNTTISNNHDEDGNWSTWTDKTFVIYYRCIFKHHIAKAQSLRMITQDKDPTIDNTCEKWQELIGLFKKLVKFIQIHDFDQKPTMITAILRFSKKFIDVFRMRAMPTFDTVFKNKFDVIKKLLTELQQGTRLIQQLCGMTKKDLKFLTCIKSIPAVKRSLELFLCRVKTMADKNECPPGVFFLGQLKHRTIHGEEISTPDMNMSRGNEDDADENGSNDEEENDDNNEHQQQQDDDDTNDVDEDGDEEDEDEQHQVDLTESEEED